MGLLMPIFEEMTMSRKYLQVKVSGRLKGVKGFDHGE